MRDPYLMILAGGISSRMKKSMEARTKTTPELRTDALMMSKATMAPGPRIAAIGRLELEVRMDSSRAFKRTPIAFDRSSSFSSSKMSSTAKAATQASGLPA